MKQRGKLESVFLACHLTASLAYKVVGVYAYDVVHKSLLLKGLCPELVSLATMSGMVRVSHSPLVVTDKALNVLLAAIVNADKIPAVEHMQGVEVSRLGFVDIELHNRFMFVWLNCV
jgi:hypothetical protein